MTRSHGTFLLLAVALLAYGAFVLMMRVLQDRGAQLIVKDRTSALEARVVELSAHRNYYWWLRLAGLVMLAIVVIVLVLSAP